MSKRPQVSIVGALCTDIEAIQFARGSCSVNVSFMSHQADWDIKEYVKQHPVMQHWQQVQQGAAQAAEPAAGYSTQLLGPFEVVLVTYMNGSQYQLTGLPVQHIRQTLVCDAAPPAVALQERVRMCMRHQHQLQLGDRDLHCV